MALIFVSRVELTCFSCAVVLLLNETTTLDLSAWMAIVLRDEFLWNLLASDVVF